MLVTLSFNGFTGQILQRIGNEKDYKIERTALGRYTIILTGDQIDAATAIVRVECESPPGRETLINVSMTALSNPGSPYRRIRFQIETQNVNRKADELVLSYVDRSKVMVSFSAKSENVAKNIRKREDKTPVTADSRNSNQHFRDEHQKVHRFMQGDVVALPAGVAHWNYSGGEESLF